MKAASVYSRAVRKAAEMVGGRDELARMLQVPPDDVQKWIVDGRKPPREIFLRVVDILIEDAAGADSPVEPPSGRDAAGERHAALFD